jgi:chemotaxis protein CheD
MSNVSEIGSRTLADALRPALPGFEHINRYWDKDNKCVAAKLLPGEYYVTLRDEAVVTVLGSCVSACIRDRKTGIGGMNHFMLPENARTDGRQWGGDVLSSATRFGNNAMERLINDILKNGGERRALEVKIFGGGRILAQMTDIGHRNIEFVHDYLRTESLALVAEDTGDTCPRKIVYFPASGRVRVKKLRSLHNETIIQRETRYLQDIGQAPVSGSIELF